MAITSWRRLESEKQVRARNANESTARTLAAAPAGESGDSFVCECGDRSCACAISLTLAEYASVRAYATHFAIAPNHENPENELVIAEGERFAVIATVSPEAAKVARRSDPRLGAMNQTPTRLPRKRGRRAAVNPVARRTVRHLTNDGGPNRWLP